MQGMLPFFMLLIYILPMYRLISNLVSEKESKARESMKMMGLTDSSYWLSWFAYYTIIVTVISVLVLAILCINVLKYSNRGLIFLYFWTYGISLFGLAVFMQSFFNNARISGIAGTLVYFGTQFISATVANPSVSPGSKNAASLLPTVAVSLGASVIGEFETNGRGVQNENTSEMYVNYSYQACLIMLAISFGLFLSVGLYLDNTFPSAYGVRKPWYFCLTRSFCCGTASRKRSGKTTPRDNRQDLEDQTDFETKYVPKNNFEPVSRELQKLEQENKIFKISDLKKTFENGFQAVRGVNLKMYNGQIFALLGHNGAGKTTTISMLTGLIESSSGSAEVFGTDLFQDMDSVRQDLGVCPQHDILFDLLTPEEHLDIFCDFKGVNPVNKTEEIKKMLIDSDIYHFKDTIARNLSGGSKRKLSVGIALIGGSRLVLLDEPTSGMDLSARRKLWNMLKNYKQGRIMILTTHYMDEADILGDRIGIMAGGKLVCVGSSLFLKNRYGVGYNVTMVKQSKDANEKILPFFKKHLGQEINDYTEVSSEFTVKIPSHLSFKFKDFFVTLDNELSAIGVRSYGISVTTLEEVFLAVGHGEEEDHQLKLAPKAIDKEELLTKGKLDGVSIEDDFSISDPANQLTVAQTFFSHIGALFLKRFYIYSRNRRGLVTEILVPVLLCIIGFGFSYI